VKKGIALAALLIAAALAAFLLYYPSSGTAPDAAVFIGARSCGVELEGKAPIEALSCDAVPSYLAARLPPGTHLALAYIRDRDEDKVQSLADALRAAGYELTLADVKAPAGNRQKP